MTTNRFALSDGTCVYSDDVYADEDFFLALDRDELIGLLQSPAFRGLAERELDARYAVGI